MLKRSFSLSLLRPVLGAVAILASGMGACTTSPVTTSHAGSGGTSGSGAGSGAGTGAGTGSTAGPGGIPGDPGTGGGAGMATPFEAASAPAAVRKVKNLLVGLPPTDADVATAAAMGTSGLKQLVDTWMNEDAFKARFKDKMVFFFRNAFQQTSFSPLDDFKPQLLQNGGFDFGPLGANVVGDDAFARLVQNLQDSFALTAWEIIQSGQPFSDVLTTRKYMMTTALKSLYLQIEMPNDQPFAFNQGNTTKLAWRIDTSGNPIPLEDSLNPASPNYMVFDDQPPAAGGTSFGSIMGANTCRGGTNGAGAAVPYSMNSGYATLFQRLLGMTPRSPFEAVKQTTCFEHASKPYFTTTDVSDWQMVTIHPLQSGEAYVQPYDLPTLRKTTDLGLKLPRTSFFTTPAFLALWNTNDSNQHRVTANQTLLVAFGASFTSANGIVPLSSAGLDAAHSVAGSDCNGCHKSLDPLRQFWANQFDFNDRNDFPSRAGFTGAPANPRPTTLGGLLAMGNVNATGASMLDLGGLLLQVQDGADASQPISRFAVAMTQKLCYFANSAGCLESDPEFRRVARAFEGSKFDFRTLVRELFSSPLVTGATKTATFADGGVMVSIARKDQLCGSLSARLGRDVCALSVPLPSQTQNATIKIATALPADAFSRGSEIPITASDPTLFFRAATEMLCENVANQVVDGASPVYASADSANAMAKMVTDIMGYPPSDGHYAMALQILKDHYAEVMAATKGSTAAATALKSVFTLACESPTSLAFGI